MEIATGETGVATGRQATDLIPQAYTVGGAGGAGDDQLLRALDSLRARGIGLRRAATGKW